MKTTGFVLTALVATAIWASYRAFANNGTQGADLALAPVSDVAEAASRLVARDRFPSLDGATGWINTPPLSSTELRGKVVLVEFWTYTCINWRREAPYVRAWAARYKDKGLVVIGVHSPEFGFEENIDNVRRAAKEIGIAYPVAVDSRHAIWRAFDNAYWPALYFIDARGRVRGQHFGEGDYDKSERLIQRLLAEAGASDVGSGLVSVDARGTEAAADWTDLQSPESYVGYDRAENFASPGGAVAGKTHVYSAPERLGLNHWALSGEWTVQADSVLAGKASAAIDFVFHARDLNLVMGPVAAGLSRRFRVSIDGKPPGLARGVDVDEHGDGTIAEPRLYQLVRQSGTISNRRIEIEFLDPGAEVFDFTFG